VRRTNLYFRHLLIRFEEKPDIAKDLISRFLIVKSQDNFFFRKKFVVFAGKIRGTFSESPFF